nr:hypothetical protein [Lachnospiraceae bacterium]
PATNAQVNAIVKASETYADKGYNVFERNCTTFVNEMIRDHAHLNTGGKIFEKEEMRFDAKSNVMRGGLSWATPFMDVYTLNKMTNNAGKVDDSYAGYGNMKVTKDEIQQYKKSRNYFNPVKKGYTPAVTAENLRRIPGNNNSILGSFYYYGGLNVEEPEGKGHANASNLKDVTYQEVENQLMTTGNDLQAAILQLLPEEMQYQANEERPQDIQNFLEASAFACEAYGDLIMTSNTRKNKLGEKAASEDVEDYVSFDEIKNAYTRLQKYQADISRGFSQTFQGDTRLESKVMNMLSIISIAFQQINGFYQAKYRKTERQSADLGDIRTEMKRLFKLKSGDDSIDISPTRYEAYLAIYKSPAAVIEAYARLKELKKAQQDETITDDEQKELDRLVDIDGTADEFVTSHDYLLQKDNYTQQDLDYIFKLKAREKRGLEGKNLNTFNKGDSAAGIYQALVMDKIFGGIKAAYLRDYDKQQLNVPKSLEVWLSNYIVEKSWNHAKELEMVIRAIRRVSPRHTKKTLYNYMSTMVSQMYLGKVFPYGSEDNKLAVANLFVQPTMEEIMKKGNSGFPLLVKALIDKIMKEKT